ncbi:MAG: TauD/TfdA family dioxygenase [Ilumatobacteraceae bacterium]
MLSADAPIAPRQDGPAVWLGSELSDPAEWTWTLTDDEIDELLIATHSPEARPLPTVAARLERLSHRLIHGRGFELLRGFPAADLDDDECEAVFVLLGTHLGALRSQNAAGDLVGNVRDVGLDVADPNVRIYQTNRRQTFHTDSTDVVGLMCLQTAVSGGESLLVSAGAIYNEMLDRDADLAAAMFEPVATDRRGEVPPGAEPFFRIPVLSWYADDLTVLYQRQYIESARRFADAPPLTDRMVAALDLFDEIANDTRWHLPMTLEVGDIQFVHNHALLHDRTAFVDDPAAPRHLLRLWLAMPGDRELPPIFAQRYGSIEIGNRGGIVV